MPENPKQIVDIVIDISCPPDANLSDLGQALRNAKTLHADSSIRTSRLRHLPTRDGIVRVQLVVESETDSPVEAEADVDRLLEAAGFVFFPEHEERKGCKTGARELSTR